MVAGVFLFVVDFLLLLLVLEALMALQMRAFARAGEVGRRGAPPRARGWDESALEAADAAFLAFAARDAAASTGGYVVFLGALDLWARARIAGGDAGPLLAAGAVAAIAVIVAGRAAARASAWRRFADEHAALWQSAEGLHRGANARTVATYMDWRASAAAGRRGP